MMRTRSVAGTASLYTLFSTRHTGTAVPSLHLSTTVSGEDHGRTVLMQNAKATNWVLIQILRALIPFHAIVSIFSLPNVFDTTEEGGRTRTNCCKIKAPPPPPPLTCSQMVYDYDSSLCAVSDEDAWGAANNKRDSRGCSQIHHLHSTESIQRPNERSQATIVN